MTELLVWVTTNAYMRPALSACGRYQVVTRVGGSMGPVFQAQVIVGLGIAHDVGAAQDLVEDAKAEADTHFANSKAPA